MKFVIDSFDSFPKSLKNVFVQCKSQENMILDQEDCENDSSKNTGCFRVNPALVIESCSQLSTSHVRHGCE